MSLLFLRHEVYRASPPANETLAVSQRANATFVILARNSDLEGTVRSVREIEDRFNRRFRYPYVFLNEEEFSDEFIKCVSACSNFLISPRSDCIPSGVYRYCLLQKWNLATYQRTIGISLTPSMSRRQKPVGIV